MQALLARPGDRRLHQGGADAAAAPGARNHHPDLAEAVTARVDVQAADDLAVHLGDEVSVERPRRRPRLDVDRRLAADPEPLFGDGSVELRERVAILLA